MFQTCLSIYAEYWSCIEHAMRNTVEKPSDTLFDSYRVVDLIINFCIWRNRNRSSRCASVETNLNNICEDVCSIPGLTQWVKDPALLWLGYRLAAVALIRPLAWELPFAAPAALKNKKQNTKEKIKKKKERRNINRRTSSYLETFYKPQRENCLRKDEVLHFTPFWGSILWPLNLAFLSVSEQTPYHWWNKHVIDYFPLGWSMNFQWEDTIFYLKLHPLVQRRGRDTLKA